MKMDIKTAREIRDTKSALNLAQIRKQACMRHWDDESYVSGEDKWCIMVKVACVFIQGYVAQQDEK